MSATKLNLVDSESAGRAVVERNPASTPAIKPARARSQRRSPDWEPEIPGQRPLFPMWDDYMAMARRVVGRFFNEFQLRQFNYMHPVRLQPGTPRRLRKVYPVKVSYTD